MLSILIAGCATTEDVTSRHMHARSLMEPCVATEASYLYASENSQYFTVFRSKMVSYRGASQKRIVSEPDHILTAGTVFKGSHLALEHSMTVAAGIWLYGTATTPNEEVYKVRDLIETVGIDLVEWQAEHGAFSRPAASDYLARVSQQQAAWCLTYRSSRSGFASARTR